ncbi:KdsC family phosphatase [Aminipila sp.]|uniref:KdsC family phosphatase n=1 Tax=Aminipila sp. TaxID=2060095 RepID=UPI00289C9EB4|nr:HAD hydrolase family protein [Aminipila sp.]
MFNDLIASTSLIVYDFDGVMTDNRVILNEDGSESVIVSRADGYAVNCIKGLNIRQIILSTEKNSIVACRAKKLGIPVIHGVEDKKAVLFKYCEEHNIPLQGVLFVGNDLNDIEVMKSVGVSACPLDAEEEIQRIAHWVIPKKGGFGVIRELYRRIELIFTSSY